ncbi:MAG: Hsp70 family protein, partial [Gordonia sp. (in: high G+C Gram-positive bacteria)]
MSSPETRRRLCIDFGTSNTVAAFRIGLAEPVLVPLSGGASASMPSAVFADGDILLVGQAAVHRRLLRPDAYEESPKSRITDVEIELGERYWEVTEVIGAVLAHVCQTARRYAGIGDFDSVILTHPDDWSERRRAILRESARRGGIRREQIRTASESLAAAWYYVFRGHDVVGAERMCVFDFGGGTCDVAVLVHDGNGGFVVTGSGGDNGLGGRDLDARLQRWVFDEVAHLDPALVPQLQDPASRLTLADNVRRAKEALSESAQAVVDLPGTGRSLLLTRREFDEMIGDVVGRAVELTREAIARADTVTDGVAGPVAVYLTGGTSSIPAIQAAMSQVGRVARLGDPKTVVAQGGLLRSTNVEVPGPPGVVAAVGAVPAQLVGRTADRVSTPQGTVHGSAAAAGRRIVV